MLRRGRILVTSLIIGISSAAFAQIQTVSPHTVREWLEREHQFLHRYLAVVQQATHDYAYEYKTPALLMPVAMDLFTGYVAYLHDAEERFLYPVLRAHMTPEQQHDLWLIQADQQEESGTVKGWQQDLVQYDAGRKKLTKVADTIDYLGRMINRHLVLQEQHVFPILDALTPKEQATILKEIGQLEQEVVGASGRARYEVLLSGIEGQIKAIAGRIW